MSLSFLFCKSWHPATTWNQKKIWEAEQKDAKRRKDEEIANKELVRETDRIRYNHMAGAKEEQDGATASVNFMYAPPPGYQQREEEELGAEDQEVKRFKMLAKMKSDPNFSAAAHRSELEKLVGRRINAGVSLAEQQERFPFLKDAPVEHAYAANVKVNFKPFNKIVRHVKCSRCGEWGHRSGDRECQQREFNPQDKERLLREDPLSYMAPSRRQYKSEHTGEGVPPQGTQDSDQEFLASLSSKEKRQLLRKLKDMEAGHDVEGDLEALSGRKRKGGDEEEEEEDGGRKKEKKSKKRKKKHHKGKERKRKGRK